MSIRGVVAVASAGLIGGGVALAGGPGLDDAVRQSRLGAGGAGFPDGPGSFVNWENPHVSPLAMTPDGSRLLAVNTPDNRLEVFDLTGAIPKLVFSVPVGLDPVSVRARTNTEAWVVNHISDSVSIVSLTAKNVVATIRTADEPADVVFAGAPQRAFVSCSQANLVQVFDPLNTAAAPIEIPIDAEDPRAMAVSPDGLKVYVAVFESGNGSTALGGGAAPGTLGFPPNAVSNLASPYGGVNPPPNNGAVFNPPLAPGLPLPPRVALIVKKNASGLWVDDNGANWTNMVSGPQASLSGRPVGWDLPDRDVAIIDASGLGVTWAHRLMNLCMAIGVNPATGRISVVGTDAINEVRFEPIVNGRFIRVNVGLFEAASPTLTMVKDMNPHLTYATSTLPTQAERQKALGDPRGIAWNAAGTRGYVTGMGSNNVIVIDAAGNRAGLADTIPVGEGPTGVVVDNARQRVYVLNKFGSSVSSISTATEVEVARIAFFDPSPAAIKIGRKHLYNTHLTSGLGMTSCASCHADARLDRLAWDLGDPSGGMKALTGLNLGAGILGLAPPFAAPAFQPFHPMKGPMTTQTLQHIIGMEPHHWRGDRLGLEEFNPAFEGLLGDDVMLTPSGMQEFEDFLATITYPPNPFRNFDNSLKTSLPLPGHFTTGRFSAAGQPLPIGNAQLGLNLYRDGARRLDAGAFACVTCHTLPTGAGSDMTFSGGQFVPLAAGPQGQRHLQVVSTDGSTNVTIKTPQLRNAYEKTGFNVTQVSNRAGFGYLHDGSVDSLEQFIAEPVFTVASDQEVAHLTAFVLSISGSDLPQGSPTNMLEPPGPPSKDTHAAVGWQTTLNSASPPAAQLQLITDMINQAALQRVGLIVKGRVNGLARGFVYQVGGGQFQSDRIGEVYSPVGLRQLAAAGSELTYTVVPIGTQARTGVDRDSDGVLDGDEAGGLGCYANCNADLNPSGQPNLTVADFGCFQSKYVLSDAYADCNGDAVFSVADFGCFQTAYVIGCP
ncbi:MAG: hypothetical protein ACKVU4_09705 [Phycisphaerales bacterium]